MVLMAESRKDDIPRRREALSGTRSLRRRWARAPRAPSEVRGILSLCDQIERTVGLALNDLADALDRFLADPLVFLPAS